MFIFDKKNPVYFYLSKPMYSFKNILKQRRCYLSGMTAKRS